MPVKESIPERILTSSWHFALFLAGLWELKNHKRKSSKILAAGFALWHADATLSHLFQRETYAKQGLRKLTRIHG